jgi:hypothetical protein
MSFDLAVVAAEPGADEAAARELIERCYDRRPHLEGDLDARIVTFYEELRAIYPDHPPHAEDAPWACAPLDTGIDHVFMNIRHSADIAVIEAIQRLATEHGLVLYDPQGDAIYLPV